MSRVKFDVLRRGAIRRRLPRLTAPQGLDVLAFAPSAFAPKLSAKLTPRNKRIEVEPFGPVVAIVQKRSPFTLFHNERSAAYERLTLLEDALEVSPLLVASGDARLSQRQFSRLALRFGGMLTSLLNTYGDLVEFEIQAMCDLAQLVNAAEAAGQVPRRLALPEGALRTAHERDIEIVLQREIDKRKSVLATRVGDGVTGLANHVDELEARGGNAVWNARVILKRTVLPQLDATLKELGSACGLTFQCIGPTPATSYASISLETPDLSKIKQSLRQLGAPKSTTLGDLKAHYLTQLKASHPDVAAGEHAHAIASEVTSAFQYLSSIAQTRGAVSPSDPIDFGDLRHAKTSLGLRLRDAAQDGRRSAA